MNSKAGIDFLPLSTDFFEDDKIALVEAEFGIKGSYIAIRLLCKIFKFEGYYCEWSRDICLLFVRQIRMGELITTSVVEEVVQALLRRDFFDKGMYDTHHILTSKGIQRRFFEATKRRQNVMVNRDYLLVPIDQSGSNAPAPTPTPTVRPERTDASHYERSVLELFFFDKNFLAPEKEMKNFEKYNKATHQDWDRQPERQKLAVAALWEQQTKDKKVDNRRRFPEAFLSCWKSLYAFALLHEPHNDTLHRQFLQDAITYREKDNAIRCPKNVADFIIQKNDKDTRKILAPLLAAGDIKWYITDNNTSNL